MMIGIPPVPRPRPPDRDDLDWSDSRIGRLAKERDELWYALEEAESALTVFCGSEEWVGTAQGDTLDKIRSILGMV